MNEADAIEIVYSAIWTIIVTGGPTAVTGSFMGSQIFAFANETYGRISTGF